MKSPQMLEQDLNKFNKADRLYKQAVEYFNNDQIDKALSYFEKSIEVYRPHARNVLYHSICVFLILNQGYDINFNISTMSKKNIKLSKEMLENLESITELLRRKLIV